MKNNVNFKIKKIFVFALISFVFMGALSFAFAKKQDNSNIAVAYNNQVEALAENVSFSEDIESFYQNNSVATVYNFVVPVRFSGENDILNTVSDTYEKSYLDVLYDMYNAEDKYSVKKYYQVVSNGKLNLETVFILDNNKSVQVSNTRSSLGNKLNNNGVGYDPNKTVLGYLPYHYVLEYQMLNDICDVAVDFIKQN